MRAMPLARRALLDSLCEEFLASYRHGRTLIAIDGIDGSGKTEFADDLATRLQRRHHAFRASMDAFHRPRAERDLLAADSPAGYYAHAFDYDLFRRVLIEPFRLGGSTGFVTSAYDVRRDVPVVMEWQTGPQDATLIVDGVYLNRPELRGLWHWSVRLEVTDEAADAGLITRAGAATAPRPAGAQEPYLAHADPRAAASVIVDNSDPCHPVRSFADSC